MSGNFRVIDPSIKTELGSLAKFNNLAENT